SEKSGVLNSTHVLLLATGFCGGFTTFSAFANEAWMLGTKGDILMSIAYIVASVIVGILCVWLGRTLFS
ncbi:MAG: CrcB family protein, partial [Bacteroidales bacterium]|nr:CrcB family protein [Bacteroidales bacterium]